ncbi:DUF1700 domain-containing protein [Lachnospiraceae bacterium OttesenSCG-928-D06]|nr:DUF1700 domain-containing protein [Lachnospiraceae bacterium OttesenSCG-928-D06]
MGKQEFVDNLRITLNGRISPSMVMEHVNYYENYINSEIQKGKSESEVMNGLGDPRLIARTIVDANKRANGEEDNSFQGTYYQEAVNQQRAGRGIKIPLWVWVILVLVVLILIIRTAFSVVYYFMPILMPVLLILFLIKLFKDWLR